MYSFLLFESVGKSSSCYFILGILTDKNWSSCLRYSYENCHWCQFSSVAQLCPTLCDPMDCSTPGLPVHHQLPEFTQPHVHWVSDAIQPPHPLLSPLLPPSIFPTIRVFSNESVLRIRQPKYWSFSLNISPSSATWLTHNAWWLWSAQRAPSLKFAGLTVHPKHNGKLGTHLVERQLQQ